MILKILGTRGKIEEKRPGHVKHSGILVDNKILFDLGEQEFLKYNPESIFITHLHPDHAFFVEGNKEIKINIPVYAPEKSEKLKSIKIISKPLETNGYRFIPIPTLHGLKIKSQGYIIEKDNKRVLYTGDVAWIEKQHYDKFASLDLVITEASYIRKGGMIRRDAKTGKIYGHTGIPNLVNLFKSFTRRIVFMHFGTWFMKDVLTARKKIIEMENKELELNIAYDGKEYVV